MPRPDQSAARRAELLPVIAEAFAELGYRRASTDELAGRCGVRVNVLYRLWPDKKAMFVAAIHHVFERSLASWERVLERAGGAGADTARTGGTAARGAEPTRSGPTASAAAAAILRHEARHLGEHGLYRILFAGLGETDDPEIKAALAETYGRFVTFIRARVAEHRGEPASTRRADVDLATWAILGLGTMANIGRELELLPTRRRERLLSEIGALLLDG